MNVRDFYKKMLDVVVEVTGVGEMPLIYCNRTECVDARSILVATLVEEGLSESEIAANMGVTQQCVNRLKNGFQQRRIRLSVRMNHQEVQVRVQQMYNEPADKVSTNYH